jgi:UDP-N-acetylmuramate--alanine ligase
MLELPKNRKTHFVGIGGIGMSGIAEVLLGMGFPVSGSDLTESAITQNLRRRGAQIFKGHHEANLGDVGLVVCSSAINPRNPEVQRAQEANIPVVRRAEVLAELMRLKTGIAVAGSHGKTTTTSILATIFHEAGRDPTHIIGGVVENLGGNARKGEGDVLIAEADESDGSFLLLPARLAVITNIDNDHLDHYGSEENIRKAFLAFASNVPASGTILMNGQDPGSQTVIEKMGSRCLRFGIENEEYDYTAANVEYGVRETSFDLFHCGALLGRVRSKLSGAHNVQNALAAAGLAHQSGIPFEDIRRGFDRFVGVGRRMERLWSQAAFEIIDDYGHHPTEIRVTLETLKKIHGKHLCVVFEPHRFTRTQQLWREFTLAFENADEVFIGPIYAASETPIEGITAEKLAAAVRGAHYLPRLAAMQTLIDERKNLDMIFLTLGAGSISKTIRELVKKL